MSRRSPRAAALAALVLGVAGASCSGDSTGVNQLADTTAPKVTLRAMSASTDTTVAFQLTATDNLGLKHIAVRGAGQDSGLVSYDTTFTSAVTTYSVAMSVGLARTIPAGTTVRVYSIATDGAGNRTVSDTVALSVGHLGAPTVRVSSPATGTAAISGKSLLLGLVGTAPLKVRYIGYNSTGAFTAADSIGFTSPLRDTVSAADTLKVPASASGTETVVPFVVDSLGQRITGGAIQLSIGTLGSANTVPVVTMGINPRIEVSDTVLVQASDPTGITVLGYEVRDLATHALLAIDSTVYTSDLTSRFKTFQMHVPISSYPAKVTVQAFARNGSGTRAYVGQTASSTSATLDTAVVVAGVTRALPNGGAVADAYYHPRFDRLFLTNIEKNQLEVFSLADSTFKTPIIVGARPWGIVPWPRDRNGTAGDTLLVANSGGTNVSYVSLDAQTAGQPSGSEVYRYPLPNILVGTVKTVTASSSGQLIQQVTYYDFADRPQYLAATCRSGSTSAACGDVVLVYSTTPTGGQSKPFTNMGTVRWEDLTTHTSHFFFEQAVGQDANSSDTLTIYRYAAQDQYGRFVGSDSVLVPAVDFTTKNKPVSEVVTIGKIAFRDTTFVRNSGNFQRVTLGEGGDVVGSRALTYDVNRGLLPVADPLLAPNDTLRVPYVDAGVSRATDVSDFVANTYQRVQGVATNFDGSLSAIRGDSTYLISNTLRLQGLLQSTSPAGAVSAGFDFHPLNTGMNSTPLATRLAFAASNQPQIDVFDTYCYQKVATVPTRDPIVGPIKVAIRPNGTLVLVGATVHGVVIVQLPNNFSTSCY